MAPDRKRCSPRARRFFRDLDAWHRNLKSAPDPDILRSALQPAELEGKAGRHRALISQSVSSLQKKLDRSLDWDLLWLQTVQKMTTASIYYLFTGERRALRWAVDALECMETCKRRHFNYSTLTGTVDIDLRTASVIRALSCMQCAFGRILDARLKRRVKRTAVDRCLRPALAAMRSRKYRWCGCRDNWRSVMTGSFAIGAMVFSDVFEEWAEIIEYGVDGVLTIMELGDRAGGWNEGPGYWEYGIVHCAELAFFLKAFTAGKVDLFKHSFLRCTGDFMLYMTTRPGQVWNWSDCHKHLEPSICAAILARVYQDKAWQHLARQQGVKNLRQAYFLDPGLGARLAEGRALSKLFPDLGVAVMRTGFTKEDAFVGVKAGKVSTGIGHCHLDLGSVVVFAGGKELLAENEFWPYAQLGTDRRAGGFFESDPDGRSWNYDGNAGISHNLLTIGDRFPRRDLKARARILNADFGSGHDLVLVDATPFYRPLATRVRRYVAYLRPDVLVLVDELRTRQKVKARVLYHFLKRAQLGDDSFTISNGGAELLGRTLCPSRRHNIVLGLDERRSAYNTERGLVQVENKYVYTENLHRDKRLVFVSVLAFGKKPMALPGAELVGDPDLDDRFAVRIRSGRRRTRVTYDLKKGTMAVRDGQG
jgi:heparinase II/III-like protein